MHHRSSGSCNFAARVLPKSHCREGKQRVVNYAGTSGARGQSNARERTANLAKNVTRICEEKSSLLMIAFFCPQLKTSFSP